MFKGVCVGGGWKQLDEVNIPSKHLSAPLVARQQCPSPPLHFILFFAPSSLSVTALTGGLILRGEADFFLSPS